MTDIDAPSRYAEPAADQSGRGGNVALVVALALGLAAGFPFAVIFETVQRRRPDAPGAAVALVNGCAVLAILVGTPLAGLAFDLPGDGAVAFAAIGVLAAAALPFVGRLTGPVAARSRS